VADDKRRTHLELNRRSGLRLQRLVDGLSGVAPTWTVATGGEWSIGVELAHMAFWDRFVAERWQNAERTNLSTPAIVDLSLFDLINDAAVPGWSLIASGDAARMAVVAADEVNAVIAALPGYAVETLLAAGWTSLLDRSVHRDEHLEALERRITSPEPA